MAKPTMSKIETSTDTTEPDEQAKVDHWTRLIMVQWNQTFGGIIETGKLLQQAKDDLPFGAWMLMFQTHEMPFSNDTAGRLMRIASHARLSDSATWRNLPLSYRALSELSRLTPERFDECLRLGHIHPDMRVIGAAALARRISGLEDEELDEKRQQQLSAARQAYVIVVKRLIPTLKGRTAEITKAMEMAGTPWAALESFELNEIDADE